MKRLVAVIVALTLARACVRAQPPVLTSQPASRAVWLSCSVSFNTGVSGGEQVTYQWQFNGTNLTNDIITTVVGNGIYGYSGDGGPATNASFINPEGVALDASGNIFVADQDGGRVREVATNGIIRTVAGTGTNGISGDGGPAINAGLGYPYGVVVDKFGNLFILDEADGRVRKVGFNGIIATVAGSGARGYSGDGGPATNASLDLPYGEAVDARGNLFIADTWNNRIRKVSTNGIITTVAGIGPSGTPGGYSGDGGAATNARLNVPYGVAADTSGNLFIADTYNGRIRMVDTNGIITTVAGNGTQGFSGDGGPATNASFSFASGVAVDAAGDLYILDRTTNNVRKVDGNGIITTVAGTGKVGFSGDGGPATNAIFEYPSGLAVDSFGDIFIADGVNLRIRKVTNAQGSTLAMNNATPGNAGAYRVVVTGFGGSVTSSVATLVVATGPVIYGSAFNAAHSVTLSCLSPPGSTNVVLRATNLPPAAGWQALSTNMAGGDGGWQFTDVNAGSLPTKFYRFLTH